MGRDYKRKKNSDGRMGDTFVILPHVVLDSAAFQSLSHKAKALLLDIARQYNCKNNGGLRCGRVYLSARGWKSNDVITSAKQELLQAGLIFETCKGARPNKASLYALTWCNLSDPFDSRFDPEVENFKRGAFLDSEPKKAIAKKNP